MKKTENQGHPCGTGQDVEVQDKAYLGINPFTPDSAKSKIDKFSKIINW